MRSPSDISVTNPLQFSTEDDFSYYYTFFQDAPGPSFLASPPPFDSSSDIMSKRRIKAQGDVDKIGEENKKRNKKRSIARLLTSLAAIDAQAESDRRDSDDSARRELSLLEANHQHKTEAMLGHYSRLEDHFDELDESDTVRSKRARVAATAAVSSAAAAAATAETSPSRGAGGAPQHHRRLWVKDRSRDWWDRYNHPDVPEHEFRQAFRMGRATFDMICEELGSAVAKEDTMLRAAVPVRQRVAVCLWRLATGEPLRVVSKRFGLGISTCHKLVLEVCSAIKTRLMPKFLQWPANPNAVKSQFEAMSGIPNVIGSMYTTHIPIIAPKISVAAYFNRRHTERNQKTSYSITVQGVVDPEGVFTDVCIGWPGSMSDHQVLEKSALRQRADAGMLENSWVVSGPSFPLLDWVLVPYSRQNLTWTQHAFNEKVGEVKGIAKEAFARLKGRWSCLQRRTEVKLLDLPVVLGACCVLHNICEMRKEEFDPAWTFELVDDEVVVENSVLSPNAKQARDNIAHNLLHRGLAGATFF